MSHNWRKTTLQGIICNGCGWKPTPIHTTSSRSSTAVMNFRHTTGTIPTTISKLQVTFVTTIWSSVHRKTAPSYHTVLNVELKVTSQQSVLPNNRIIDSRMKDVKVPTKDAKLTEKIGRNHRTDHSSPTRPTNALTVQAITGLGIVQIDSNHKHPPLAHNNSPQQHSQQSASTMNISTPTLMVNNPLQSGPQQGKQ